MQLCCTEDYNLQSVAYPYLDQPLGCPMAFEENMSLVALNSENPITLRSGNVLDGDH